MVKIPSQTHWQNKSFDFIFSFIHDMTSGMTRTSEKGPSAPGFFRVFCVFCVLSFLYCHGPPRLFGQTATPQSLIPHQCSAAVRMYGAYPFVLERKLRYRLTAFTFLFVFFSVAHWPQMARELWAAQPPSPLPPSPPRNAGLDSQDPFLYAFCWQYRRRGCNWAVVHGAGALKHSSAGY